MKLGLILILFLSACQLPAQSVFRQLDSVALSSFDLDALRKEFTNLKDIPADYEKQVLIAFSYYPQLRSAKIRFRYTPLESNFKVFPAFSDIFRRKGHRRYIVKMCKEFPAERAPAMLPSYPFDAQVGVFGHEFAHIAYFDSRSTLQLLLMGLRLVSTRYTDKFENMTDGIAIRHGLGWQLLAWSEYIRAALAIKNYRGVKYYYEKQAKNKQYLRHERYMNPETILRKISEMEIYKQGRE